MPRDRLSRYRTARMVVEFDGQRRVATACEEHLRVRALRKLASLGGFVVP